MKFSIITVCYNSERFIASAIDSVLGQTYSDIEYIIIDGNSKDNTLAIIRTYENQITHFKSEPDNGIYDAMNKGLSLSSGDIIGILNSDDFYLNSDTIADIKDTFDNNPNCQMVFGNIDFVRSDDLNVPTRFYSSFSFDVWKMRFGFMPAHPSAFITRSTYEKVGFYKLGYEIGADFEWFVRALLIHRLPYVKINRTIVRMREGGVSTSGIKSYWLTSKEQVRALRSNGFYTNFFFVFIRLPIKYLQKIFNRK